MSLGQEKRFLQKRLHLIKAMGFLLMLIIPLLGPIGYLIGTWWLAPAVIFIGVPLGDFLIGEDNSNRMYREIRWSAYFWTVPHLYVAIWLISLIWCATRLVGALSTADLAGLALGSGIASAFVTCTAHELLHRNTRFDFAVARLTMAICCYGHFVVEHQHHHSTVGRIECGTVPTAGESMWCFVFRNIRFSACNAYRVAERMRIDHGRPWWANVVVQQHCLSSLMAAATWMLCGIKGLGLFAIQAAIAIFTVELVQYFQHYGLIRVANAPVGASHSWNSNGWLTNAITLNNARHSEHHLFGAIPYQALRPLDNAPQMPFGYFGLAWIALFPVIWRTVIDPICAKYAYEPGSPLEKRE